jgi:uncharacterized membrane protein
LVGYFGLFVLLMAWYTIIAPSARLPTALILLFLVGPLLFPLRGLLHGRPYTHAWVSFLALFYFTAGVFNLAGGMDKPWLPWLEIVFSVLLFTGTVVYARRRAREVAREIKTAAAPRIRG